MSKVMQRREFLVATAALLLSATAQSNAVASPVTAELTTSERQSLTALIQAAAASPGSGVRLDDTDAILARADHFLGVLDARERAYFADVIASATGRDPGRFGGATPDERRARIRDVRRSDRHGALGVPERALTTEAVALVTGYYAGGSLDAGTAPVLESIDAGR